MFTFVAAWCLATFLLSDVDRLQESVSLFLAIQATGFLAFSLVGLSPTEHTSFLLDAHPNESEKMVVQASSLWCGVRS